MKSSKVKIVYVSQNPRAFIATVPCPGFVFQLEKKNPCDTLWSIIVSYKKKEKKKNTAVGSIRRSF